MRGRSRLVAVDGEGCESKGEPARVGRGLFAIWSLARGRKHQKKKFAFGRAF